LAAVAVSNLFSGLSVTWWCWKA